MSLPTYLELVNDILVRLREPEVTTVQDNVLSKLIGKLVNDSKRQVEDSYNWNALTSTLSAVTTANIFNYGLTGAGQRFKVIDAFNFTTRSPLLPISTVELNEIFLTSGNNAPTGSPSYYNFNGLTNNGDTQVDVYPIPQAAETLLFNLYVPQAKLSSDGDKLLVPSEPVILGAYARALVERGEDGGLNSSEAYGLYKSSLADHIANEASRYQEESSWEAV
jgi:hypothetical protein